MLAVSRGANPVDVFLSAHVGQSLPVTTIHETGLGTGMKRAAARNPLHLGPAGYPFVGCPPSNGTTGMRFSFRSKHVSIHSLRMRATFSTIWYGVWYGE